MSQSGKMVRFGLCGCGGIANLHAKCMQKLEQDGVARFVAGAEPDAQRRKTFGEKFGLEMHDSLPSLLQRDDLDAVTICSPSGLHGEHTIQIAKSGRHILCEKPLDLHLSKVDEAIAAAKAAGVVLSGIFQQRFMPGPLRVRRAVEGGYFGQIVFVHAETPWYRTQGYYDSGDWRGTWALDGGVLGNQSPHMIDRLLWLGGDIAEVLSATCDTGRERDIEAETLAVATIRLQNGALGTITGTTLAYDGLPQRVLICGTEGSAAFSGDELVHFKTKRPFEADAASEASDSASSGSAAGDPLALSGNSHEANIRDFALALRDGRAPLVSAEDGRRVVRALNLIYQKAGVGPFADA